MKVEDHARRSVVRRMVRRYKVSVAMERQEVTSDGAGGVLRSARVAQPAKDRYFAPAAAPPILGIDALGRRLEERHVLLSTVGDDIQAGDEFVVGTNRYQVEHVQTDGPELVALAIRVTGG